MCVFEQETKNLKTPGPDSNSLRNTRIITWKEEGTDRSPNTDTKRSVIMEATEEKDNLEIESVKQRSHLERGVW